MMESMFARKSAADLLC